MQKEEVGCLISVRSHNEESYMFHTPNVHLVPLQAEAAGLPLITVETEGIEEDEPLGPHPGNLSGRGTPWDQGHCNRGSPFHIPGYTGSAYLQGTGPVVF